MQRIILFFIVITLYSCNVNNFVLLNSDRTNGLDFQSGKWLIGNVEVNPYYKDKITELAYADFKSRLGERLNSVSEQKSLLIPVKVDLNPKKEEIEKLRIGTKHDYFINIKVRSNRNDINDFKIIEHDYYLKQMSFAEITLEVYNLEQGKIVYSQTARGKIDEHQSITSRPIYNVIMGCYKKIWKDIEKKSILK